MRVRVLFFGLLREIAGTASAEVELDPDASLRDVLTRYESEIPRLKDLLPSVACAVNQQYAAPETRLNDGDEIALLPPVSGGSSEVSQTQSHTYITREKINVQHVVEKIKRGEDGATLVFEGIVRNQTRGRKTLYLDYEAYEEMALPQMEALVSKALQDFQIREAAVIHRLGRIEIGETSVLIVVSSAHRAAAFDACRWLIDTLKRTVPIWKKEYFEDGAVWADGDPFPPEIARANS